MLRSTRNGVTVPQSESPTLAVRALSAEALAEGLQNAVHKEARPTVVAWDPQGLQPKPYYSPEWHRAHIQSPTTQSEGIWLSAQALQLTCEACGGAARGPNLLPPQQAQQQSGQYQSSSSEGPAARPRHSTWYVAGHVSQHSRSPWSGQQLMKWFRTHHNASGKAPPQLPNWLQGLETSY